MKHDGMPYDSIQGQGHETFKVRNFQFSKSISSGIFNVSWQMTTDSETMEQYLNFVLTRFLISVIVFVSRDFELGTKFRLIVVYLLRKKHGNRRFRFLQLLDRYRKYGL